MSASYLQRLTTQVSEGLSRVAPDVRARHAAYLRETQNPDGGWSGREGDSDLYYTAFALRGLLVLDELTPEVVSRAGGFLKQAMQTQVNVVDFYSFLYACALVQLGGPDVLEHSPPDWPDRVAEALEAMRKPDGGYSKTPEGTSGSAYHTFLVALCYQLLGRPLPRGDEVTAFLQTRRRGDGGFVDIAPVRRSGTNPTAAAVGVWQMLLPEGEPLPDDVRNGVADFLQNMATPEGGLRANVVAPLADLLSTFTGAWTLAQLDEFYRLDHEDVLNYVRSLDRADGGFGGGIWDEGRDVEYTFYGLGTLALLTPPP